MADLSAELFGTPTKSRGDELAAELFSTKPKTSLTDDILQGAGNIGAGLVRGAGSIGATILAPYDMAKDALNGKGLSLESNRERRQSMDDGLQSMGAQPDSMLYKGGKLTGEIAGTAGIGGALANVLGRTGMVAAPLLSSIRTGGMVAQGAGIGTRVAGGALTGGVSTGLVNPEDVGMGAAIGSGLPVVGKVAGVIGNSISDGLTSFAKSRMQSALKPVRSALKSGDADIAVQQMLDNGINVTKGGVDKLRGLIGDLNDQIGDKIGDSTATISKQKVLDSISGLQSKFTHQVDPLPDMTAIQGVADRFGAHPLLPDDQIPVQLAQQMKQGTYQVLAKKYGQLGSADTEAQKGLARGLKEGIADAVPNVGALNSKESDLIKTLSVAERRVLQKMNNNTIGLAGLAHSPAAWAGMMADKSSLFNSLAARALNASGNGLRSFSDQPGLLGNTIQNPLLRTGLLSISSETP
jgi:hypothetical protein